MVIGDWAEGPGEGKVLRRQDARSRQQQETENRKNVVSFEMSVVI